MDHSLSLEPQPIADQWMATCRCGWRDEASFWDFDDRDALLASLRGRYEAHLNEPATA